MLNNKEMSTTLSRHERVLELDKILSMLSLAASFEDSKQACLSIIPSYDYIEVNRELARTNAAYELSARFGTPILSGVRNMTGALKRAQAGSMLTLRELLDIGEVLRNIRALYEWHQRCEKQETALDEYFEELSPNKYFEERIINCIASEDDLFDTASTALSDIRRKIRSAGQRVRDQLDKMVRSQTYQKFLQESLITIRDGRFVIPVKAEHKGDVPGLIHDTSSSGATIFVEPLPVVEANNEIRLLKGKEKEEIERIIAELSAEAGGFCDSITTSFDTMVILDVYFAKAKLAFEMKASLPVVNDEGIVALKRARHPLIPRDKVVPIDVRLGSDFNTLVVTGPNTGGKTVTLKTIGLLTLMSMCGLMIPTYDDSRIAIFDRVLADIGDEQSIEQSLSTFSSHMTNIISILKQADSQSLVLLDELGAGTDPVEGAALAVSILEELRQKGCKIAATTHYAEIKIYALNTDGVENACCEFDVATLRPTYKLLIGVPGRSNAFAISQRLGMDERIILGAKQLISSENARFEDVVDRLEQTRQQLEQEREETERLKREAQQIREQIIAQQRSIERERDVQLDAAKGQAKQIVEQVKRDSQRILDELEELKRQKDSQEFAELTRAAKANLRASIDKLDVHADPVRDKRTNAGYKLPRPLRPGDTVLIVDIDKQGSVIEPPDKSGNVLVRAGIIKTRIKLENLRLVEQKSATQQVSQRTGVSSRMERDVRSELDIRGTDTLEGIMQLDQFIDQAILTGLSNITVIHGKGTGVLRAAVHQHLKRHKNVRTFRLGVYGEGESGVTIVELK